MGEEHEKARWYRRRTEPKSTLGFFAIVLGIVFSAVVGVVSVLALAGHTDLIPWVLGFGGSFLLLMVGGVFTVMLRDPSKLMLTHVSGEEFLAIQTYNSLGDSITGLSVEPANPAVTAIMQQAPNEAAVLESDQNHGVGKSLAEIESSTGGLG